MDCESAGEDERWSAIGAEVLGLESRPPELSSARSSPADADDLELAEYVEVVSRGLRA